MTDLTFKTLREANTTRLNENVFGTSDHAWDVADWMTATVGELGELANVLKKVRRGDISMQDAMPDVKKELADTVTYLDLLANKLDADLGDCVADKFNEVSARVGSNVTIQDGKTRVAE